MGPTWCQKRSTRGNYLQRASCLERTAPPRFRHNDQEKKNTVRIALGKIKTTRTATAPFYTDKDHKTANQEKKTTARVKSENDHTGPASDHCQRPLNLNVIAVRTCSPLRDLESYYESACMGVHVYILSRCVRRHRIFKLQGGKCCKIKTFG